MSLRMTCAKLIEMYIKHPTQQCYCCPLQVLSLTWALTHQFHVLNFVSLQVATLALAKTQLLPWPWEAPVSSSLAEMWTRLRRLWGRSSSRVTAWTSFTWSWIWPTCALWGNSARASFRERRGLTSWSIMQVRGSTWWRCPDPFRICFESV